MDDTLLTGLNEAQRSAVLHKDGPMAVYAGAGSGKTRVIVHRIAHLLRSGVPGSSIMAVTFTNKAAREMRERLGQMVATSAHPEDRVGARNILVATFHSAAARFLRVYAADIGYSQNFTIADDGDQKSLFKQITKELHIPENVASPQTLRSKIDRLKNQGHTPKSYRESLGHIEGGQQDAESRRSHDRFGEEIDATTVLRVFESYQAALKRTDAMDFNDLLVNMVALLTQSPRAREQLARRYRYFLIDEFQDTNPVQFRWMQLMSGHTNNICIVGDDDQSIYSWRGAEPKFIVDFQRYYPDAKIIKLEQNYRSSANIISAASALIARNRIRTPKTLWTANPEGAKIKVVEHSDNSSEGLAIAEEIVRHAANGGAYRDYAILYRTNAQSRVLEDELRRKMLPYIIYGSVRFYERAEIKTLLTYFRLLLNFRDDLAFAKCIMTPKRGFGEKALADLREASLAQGLSLVQTAVRIAYGEIPSPFARGLGGLRKFVELYTSLKIKLDEGISPQIILEELLHGLQFEDYLRSSYPEDFDERWLNVVELQNALGEFLETREGEDREIPFDDNGERLHPLAEFLEMASLMTEPSSRNVEDGSSDAITLMTIHSAKGLEFPKVFVCGLEEGVLPHFNSMDTDAEVEEERRLVYVAMTRAKERLTLTAVRRQRFRRDFPSEPSRFLDEIPSDFLEHSAPVAFGTPLARPGGQRAPSRDSFDLASLIRRGDEVLSAGRLPSTESKLAGCPFQIGQRVRHKIFGVGTVAGIEPTHGNFRLEVRFPRVGSKRLIHTYVSAADQPENETP